MAERLGAKQFGRLLERYYQDVTDIMFQFGGLIDKYLGDGIMAVFGMTGMHDNPEERAVSAGLEILRLLEARYRTETAHIDVGIGINSGPVVAGYVSTKERVELTVLGDTVNVAAGLEQMARPNRLLVGAKTHRAVARIFKSKPLGEVTIKDRTQPVDVNRNPRKISPTSYKVYFESKSSQISSKTPFSNPQSLVSSPINARSHY